MMKMKQFDGMIICSRTSSWEQIEPFAKFAPYYFMRKNEPPSHFIRLRDVMKDSVLAPPYLLKKGHEKSEFV